MTNHASNFMNVFKVRYPFMFEIYLRGEVFLQNNFIHVIYYSIQEV